MRHDSSRVIDRSRHPLATCGAALLVLAGLAGATACSPNWVSQQEQAFEPCTLDAGTAPMVCDLDAGDAVHNELPKNSLAAGAVNNRPLLDALRSHALVPGLFTDPTWNLSLFEGPDAIDLAAYVLACALDPCDVLSLPPIADSSMSPELQAALTYAHHAYPNGFRGELGLCGDRYNARMSVGEVPWKTAGQPTSHCQERVSACVLARVNAVNRRVMLSMRGDGLVLSDRVPTETEFREDRGTPINSFAPCSPTCGPGGPTTRNCGWRPQYVGQCVEGRTVTLQVPANTHAPIRVCRGIHGCDDRTSPGFLRGAATDQLQASRHYGDKMLAQGMDKVKFLCPVNGPLQGGVRTGYYAVMIADPPTGLVAAAEVALPGLQAQPAVKNTSALRIASSPYDVYPAPEEQVFTFREGAFFGTLWDDPSGPAPLAADLSGQMFTGDKHTCYGRMWSQGAMMASDRYCAGTDCFHNDPMPCDTTVVPNTSSLSQGVGSPDPSSPVDGEVYDSCTVNGRTWGHPYTIYLNHPCDLFAGPTDCLRRLDRDVLKTLPALP